MASFQSFLVTLLFVGSSSVIGTCPKGSTDYGDRHECVYALGANANYTVAKQICQNLGGQMMKIRDVFENAIAGAEAGTQVASNAMSYIGVIKSNGTWIYDDGTPLMYKNWQSGHPLNQSDCAVLNSVNYQWISVGCNSFHTFICTMPDDLYNCPKDWISYNGSCYYFYNPQLTAPLVYFNQSTAQSSCQSMQSNLTSIHSDDEFNFLKNQISTAAPITFDCNLGQAVIGFTCVSSVYKWLDGSLADYNQGQGNCSPSYGIINDTRCSSSAYWDWWPISEMYARYICKKGSTRPTIDFESVLKKFLTH